MRFFRIYNTMYEARAKYIGNALYLPSYYMHFLRKQIEFNPLHNGLTIQQELRSIIKINVTKWWTSL